jgi:3-deoxy-manno-octulosonate cytidylyltransferase (CMP-KDO synthetase)
MIMKFLAVIPARYASTRFPGKPLAMIDGISMVMRVYLQAKKAACFDEVVVATDDRRIFDHVTEKGGKAVMTSPGHPSGTDRVCEAAMHFIAEGVELHDHIVINIQGDEPFIDPAAIDSLASCFENRDIGIATLVKKISTEEELFDPNTVKVVAGKDRRALYFSRSALPFARGAERGDWLSATSFYKHIGVYAYRADILKEITALSPSELETTEGLEQLRWLENGYAIFTEETDYESVSVDTPGDLSKLTNKS